MKARAMAYVMAGGAVAYMALMMWQGWGFFTAGDPVALVLGIAVMVIPVLGIYLVWREINFAGKVQRLADELAARGQLPGALELTPGGRVVAAAAAEEFRRCSALVAEQPRDAAAWYAMALAYDAGRDRTRARAAMRYAVALHQGVAPDNPPTRLLPEG